MLFRDSGISKWVKILTGLRFAQSDEYMHIEGEFRLQQTLQTLQYVSAAL